MAIDRLINSTQGDSIITALNAISSKVSSPYNLENKLNPQYISYDATHAATPETVANSGITSTDVAQIEMNKNNISLLTQYGGGRNVLSVSEATTSSSVLYIERIPAGTYKFHCDTDAPSNWALKFRNASNTDVYTIESAGSMGPNSAITVTLTEDVVKISPWWQGSGIRGLTNMYLCRETDWTTPYVYQPYALSNSDLTAKNAANENNILLTADQSTQYNYMDFNSYGTGNSGTIDSIYTTTNTITVSGKAAWAKGIIYLNNVPSGTYILKYTVSSNSSASAAITMNEGSTQKTSKVWNNSTGDYTSGEITFGDNAKSLYITANNSTSTLTNSVTITITNVMLIPASVYDAGFAQFQPYAMTNVELTEKNAANENNILSIYDTGYAQKNVMRIVLDEVKALLPSQPFVGNTTTFGNLSVTFNEDNSITLNGSHTAAVAINFKDLSHINMPTNAVGAASANITLSNDIFFGLWGDSGVSNLVLNNGVDIPSDYASKYSRGFVIRVSANTVCNNVRIYPMVCDKALYQASSEVVPYALPNTTITPALVECVDNGKKNLLQFHSDTNGALVATAQSNGYSVIITGGDDVVGKTVAYADCTIEKTGNYTFRCDLSGTGASCYIYDATTGTQIREYYETSSETFTLTGGHTYQIRTYRKGSGTNATVEAMICEKSLYDVSPTYQPYAMSNAELTNNILIEEITSGITAASGYTKTSQTHVYKQGKHIFGTLVFEKSSGSYSTTGGDIVGTMGNYAPVAQWLGCGFFSDSVWTLQNCGYAFIQNAYGQGDAGQIIVTDSAGGTNNVVKIQIDYVMP